MIIAFNEEISYPVYFVQQDFLKKQKDENNLSVFELRIAFRGIDFNDFLQDINSLTADDLTNITLMDDFNHEITTFTGYNNIESISESYNQNENSWFSQNVSLILTRENSPNLIF